MNDVHQGRCISGAVRYRTTGKPFFGTVCHCTFCQRRLAGAFAVLVSFHETAVEVTQGRLSEYEHRSDVSGRWLRIRYPTRPSFAPLPAPSPAAPSTTLTGSPSTGVSG
jgi:hypothetical protein